MKLKLLFVHFECFVRVSIEFESECFREANVLDSLECSYQDFKLLFGLFYITFFDVV